MRLIKLIFLFISTTFIIALLIAIIFVLINIGADLEAILMQMRDLNINVLVK